MEIMTIFLCYLVTVVVATASKGYDLPVIPANLPSVETYSNGKLIPSKIWIAVKSKEDELSGHIKAFFARNPSWTPNVCDNDCKDQFINSVWDNTSVQWAYFMINPLLGAARADIWRYSVLYTYGGMYMDEDSNIAHLLDNVVTTSDSMILSEEGPSSLGPCYLPGYKLADDYLVKTYTNASTAKYYWNLTDTGKLEFFHGNTLINWAIFVKPRHPVFLRTLINIVEIIKAEHNRKSVLSMSRWDHKWKAIFCTTNFVYTYTLRSMLLENSLAVEDIPRIEQRDFARYGGKCKFYSTAADQSHYSKLMRGKNSPHLLREYVHVTIETIIENLEGKPIIGTEGKEIFLVENKVRRPFPDFETFVKMKFDTSQVKHASDAVMAAIPIGDPLPSLMK